MDTQKNQCKVTRAPQQVVELIRSIKREIEMTGASKRNPTSCNKHTKPTDLNSEICNSDLNLK